MPNWCTNNLTVRGPSESVSRFVDAVTVKGEGESREFQIISTLVTIPEEFNNDDNRNAEGVHVVDWQYANWGTKWGDSDTYLKDDFVLEQDRDDTVTLEVDFSFSSPWGPPLQAFITISREWSDLSFLISYEELSNAVLGVTLIANGEVLADVDLDNDIPDVDDPDDIDAWDNQYNEVWDLLNQTADELWKEHTEGDK
jgi:hypothetical protein